MKSARRLRGRKLGNFTRNRSSSQGVVRLLCCVFFAPILAHRSNYRRINCYYIDRSSLGSLVYMPGNRDVRLYDFYPLVRRLSFGQSVKETDLSPAPSDVPRPRFLLFSATTSSSAYVTSVSGSLFTPELSSEEHRGARTIGERHV